MTYIPSSDILEKYAEVLIGFALNSGEGIRPGEVVVIQLPEAAKPFYVPLRNSVLKHEGMPLMLFQADTVNVSDMYTLANEQQLDFFPAAYYKGLVDQADHLVRILAESDKFELNGVDAQKILRRSRAMRPYLEWRNMKESAGLFTWTIAMYGTPAMAADVHMTEEEYWQQIITACYLDQPDPIATWRSTYVELERIQTGLNALSISSLHVQGESVDLTVGIGPNRRWLGGSGRNIPSFELFISPDCRLTEGRIKFNQPLYQYGNMIEGIELHFHEGKVVQATATKNQELLQEIVATENGNMIGEFSLTDHRFSNITKVMGETLFDENIGGPQGNTHVALGNAYQDSYPGNPSEVTQEQWKQWGYNQSAVHVDIVSTEQRTVTATLEDDTTQIVYKDGQFTV